MSEVVILVMTAAAPTLVTLRLENWTNLSAVRSETLSIVLVDPLYTK